MHQYSHTIDPLVGVEGGGVGVGVVGIEGGDREGYFAEGNDNTNYNILTEGLAFLPEYENPMNNVCIQRGIGIGIEIGRTGKKGGSDAINMKYNKMGLGGGRGGGGGALPFDLAFGMEGTEDILLATMESGGRRL